MLKHLIYNTKNFIEKTQCELLFLKIVGNFEILDFYVFQLS